jgi:hypothetical protein
VEEIRTAFLAKIETLKPVTLKTVTEVLPENEEELNGYASTQLPLAVVRFGLPVPQEQVLPYSVAFQMSIPVSVIFYALDNVDPVGTMLSIANDFWAVIHSEAATHRGHLGGLVPSLEVSPDAASVVSHPYVMFRYDIELGYVTDETGL